MAKMKKAPMLNDKNALFGLKEGSFRRELVGNYHPEWSQYCDQLDMVDAKMDSMAGKIQKNQNKRFY